jgi:3-methyl-2-oxobutanoate hydroxymethyltransferase
MQKAPKFVKNFLLETNSIQSAIGGYVRAVKEKKFPSAEHSFE